MFVEDFYFTFTFFLCFRIIYCSFVRSFEFFFQGRPSLRANGCDPKVGVGDGGRFVSVGVPGRRASAVRSLRVTLLSSPFRLPPGCLGRPRTVVAAAVKSLSALFGGLLGSFDLPQDRLISAVLQSSSQLFRFMIHRLRRSGRSPRLHPCCAPASPRSRPWCWTCSPGMGALGCVNSTCALERALGPPSFAATRSAKVDTNRHALRPLLVLVCCSLGGRAVGGVAWPVLSALSWHGTLGCAGLSAAAGPARAWGLKLVRFF